MEHLDLGGLQLPLEAVTATFGLLAVRGAGKTNAARCMAEEMHAAGLPFVAVDPVGSWSGLRSGRDGDSAGGLPIPIFGGERGDIPLERTGGEVLADLVARQRLSCVVDISGFDSEAARKQFLTAFARRLYAVNRDPLHLFLEEADDYLPQRPMRDETLLLRAWENIVRRGRSRGLGCTLITQRSAAVNKMVLTQVETLFVLRTTGPQDLKAVEAWVRHHQTDHSLVASLAALKSGEAWAWSPHFLGRVQRFQFRLSRTYDSGATPANIRGKQARPIATLADVDLAVVRQQMVATNERSKPEDPKALQRRIAELTAEYERQLQALRHQIEGLQRDVVALRRQLMRGQRFDFGLEARALLALVLDQHGIQGGRLKELREQLMLTRVSPGAPVPANDAEPSAPGVESLPSQPPRVHGGSVVATTLPKGEHAVLQAIAQYPDGVSRQQLTVMTGYKRRTRDAYLQRLQQRAYITEADGQRAAMYVVATPAGKAALPDWQPLPTGSALLRYWLRRLPTGEHAVLEMLPPTAAEGVTRDAITLATGYKRRTRDAYIQRLAARQLVDTSSGGVKLSRYLLDREVT